jgi:nucleotide-binding universal stress UspA family protein
MPYQTMLLAYDGTPEGRRALQEGAEVAKHFRAKTHLLAVIADDAGAAMAQAASAAPPMERTQFYQGTLNEGVKFLKGEGLDATGHLVHGEPVEEIVKLAERIKADLVVVGHRERGPVARWWNTPTSMSLLDKLDCSVLIGMKQGPPRP